MLSFSTSLTALQANQVAINTIANNIANANTPGYHRQQVHLSDRIGTRYQNMLIGSGVQVSEIARSFNAIVELSISQNQSRFSDVNESLVVLRQIETVLGPGEGSIHSRLESFFNDLQQLSLDPDNLNLRSIGIQKLNGLTNEFQLVNSRLDTITNTIHAQIEHDVDSVNESLTSLFDLNRRIKIEQNSGRSPNDLLDQFQQKVNDLAQLIDIETSPASNGGFSFQIAGGSFHFESSSFQIESRKDDAGNVSYWIQGTDTSIDLSAGRLAGLQRVIGTSLKSVKNRLDQVANEFVFRLDHVHSTGLPIDGPFDQLNGVRQIPDPSNPLSSQTPFGQLAAGELFVSVTNKSTEIRQTHSIDFDPSTDSLNDLITRLNSIGGINASVTNGFLTVASDSGYAFDFAGRLENQPDLSLVTGSSVPTLSGSYTGDQNDDYTFEIVGSGTVGVDSPLQVRVTDSSGTELGVFDIGTKYEPGSPIEVANGVKIEFSSGSFNNGDQFTTPVLAESDETGVLVAVGLNTLFTGSTANDIGVSDAVLDDPKRFALSRNGQTADNSNLQRLVSLRENISINGNNFEEFVEKINLDIGQETSLLITEQTNLELIGQQLAQQVDSVSGVDPNEEMVYLLDHQRSYEASVRVISTIDQMMSELFNIIR